MKNITNTDRMLQTVLGDEKLAAHGGYTPANYETIEDALNSENTVVVAVAKMIKGLQRGYSEKDLYTEVYNYLKTNLI